VYGRFYGTRIKLQDTLKLLLAPRRVPYGKESGPQVLKNKELTWNIVAVQKMLQCNLELVYFNLKESTCS
jgi:hypothetical protein